VVLYVLAGTHKGTVSTHTCSVQRCARIIHCLDRRRRLRWCRRTCNLRRGGRERGDVRTGRRACAPLVLSSVAAPAVGSGVAPVVDNTLQRARPMQTAIRCACKGRSEADPQAPLAVQCSARQRRAVMRRCCAALQARARPKFVPWAMGSERLSAPLDSGTCACSRCTPPRTSRRGAARAQRCCYGAAPGRCGDAARCRTDRTRTARAIPPLQRYGRWCHRYHRAAHRQWCDVSTPSTPVRVLPSRYSEYPTCVREYSLCRAPPGRARRGCASRHGRLRRHRIPRRRACRGRCLQRTTV
jgi:hypothetical protein